jgi:hypothetical protein
MKLESDELRDVSYEIRNFLSSYLSLKEIQKVFNPECIEHVAKLTLFSVSCRALIEYFELRQSQGVRDYRYKSARIEGVDQNLAKEIWDLVSKGTAHLSKAREQKKEVMPDEWLSCLRPPLEHFFKNVEDLSDALITLWDEACRPREQPSGSLTTFDQAVKPDFK